MRFYSLAGRGIISDDGLGGSHEVEKMSAAPKSKTSKLIEKMNDLVNRRDRDEFTLRRIKSEAEKLRSSDAFNSYILLGMLASLANNVDEMRLNHLAALKLQPNDPTGNINYSTSLNNLCFYSEVSR